MSNKVSLGFSENRSSTIAERKASLRAHLKNLRRNFPELERLRANAALFARLMNLPEYRAASVIHTFVSWRDEVDTHAIIKASFAAGKRVAVPRVPPDKSQLEHYFISDFAALVPGTLGILEPSSGPGVQSIPANTHVDVIFVPGLAFDRSGNRLGYGRAYYDQFLAGTMALKIGLAFALQIVEEVPVAPHDQRVDLIITEQEVIRTATGNAHQRR